MSAFQSSSFRVFLLIVRINILAMAASATGGNNQTDKLALFAIKAQIIEDPFGVTGSWNDSLHFCQWRGVSCGRRHQRVTELNLSSQSLEGNISPFLGNLSFLRVLDLSKNYFQGKFPREVSHLFRLQEIVLANNSIEGQVLADLANCSRLRIVNLGFNKFTGRIPSQLGDLSKLVELKIVRNKIEGTIPPHLGNASSLQLLSMVDNEMKGDIPATLGQLRYLQLFSVTGNMISGVIPQSIYNLSSLVIMSVADNKLCGSLPRNVGLNLPNIERFRAWGNHFTGLIPDSFSNMSSLSELDLSKNKFHGKVPEIFGNLKNFTWLGLGFNDLGSDDLGFVNSLANCSNLRILNFEHSKFTGAFPKSMGNLSTRLQFLTIGGNEISGDIPPSIGNLLGLNSLLIFDNYLKGSIPKSLGKLHNLQEFFSEENELSGEIPSSIGNLTLLSELTLNENNLNGSIPSSLGNCKNLLSLDLEGNSLTGTIPRNVIGLFSLSEALVLSRNRLTGPLPSEVGNMKNLAELRLSYNQLTGDIPRELGECESLRWLYMDHNMFRGSIDSVHSLKAIELIDLSHNNFSGHIPEDFAKLFFLSELNLSFNDLEGEVPSGGIFSNVSANISLAGNKKLCGGMAKFHLVPCSKKSAGQHNLFHTGKLVISVVFGLLGVLLISYLLFIHFRKNKMQASESLSSDVLFMNISYGELLKATNGFCPENLIGVGGFGSVYRGILEPDQLYIAVKVFNLERRGASKSFMAECEALRNIRHRNLVKIITACSSIDFQGNEFKALVYEFMPNGSLEDWLHSSPQIGEKQRKILTMSMRLDIVLDVASALDYLHNRSELPIIHCDLKPSNVLLDQNMTAHVGDFGLSRIIAEDNVQISQNHTSSVGVRGTIGYAAPEYGMGSKLSTKGDVYSFGILLLGIFTGKNPTEENLEGLGLHQFVKMALPKRVMEIVDQSLLIGGEEEASSSDTKAPTRNDYSHECLISIFMVGLKCSEELPSQRMNINDALRDLHKIKRMLLKDARNNIRA